MVYDSARYDVVVFGATGFVGQLVCQYLADQVGTPGEVTWAAAGRSLDKLKDLAASLEPRVADLPLLTADATDERSLRDLCAEARVVISTVGPYALYGEPLVKACAETGTDYCDLTGEVQWIRRMIKRYESLAQQTGARIVHCCGFDSVPSDLGVYYLQQQAQARLGQPCTRVKMRLKDARGGLSGGTAASGINLIKEASADSALRDEIAGPYCLCPDMETPPSHPPTLVEVTYDDTLGGWVSPFIMAEVNTRIVLRSNVLMDMAYGSNFQYEEAILTGDGPLGWAVAQGLKVGLVAFAAAAALEPTRWVLEQFVLPASGEGPTAEDQEQGYYDLRFWGETPAGQTIQVKVTGDRDPGYGSTSRILAQAGLCLAKDVAKPDKAGGFWTPSSVFGDRLIERLENFAGLTFEVLP